MKKSFGTFFFKLFLQNELQLGKNKSFNQKGI